MKKRYKLTIWMDDEQTIEVLEKEILVINEDVYIKVTNKHLLKKLINFMEIKSMIGSARATGMQSSRLINGLCLPFYKEWKKNLQDVVIKEEELTGLFIKIKSEKKE